MIGHTSSVFVPFWQHSVCLERGQTGCQKHHVLWKINNIYIILTTKGDIFMSTFLRKGCTMFILLFCMATYHVCQRKPCNKQTEDDIRDICWKSAILNQFLLHYSLKIERGWRKSASSSTTEECTEWRDNVREMRKQWCCLGIIIWLTITKAYLGYSNNMGFSQWPLTKTMQQSQQQNKTAGYWYNE